MKQLSLTDQSVSLAEEAINRAYTNADPDWILTAKKAITICAKTLPDFTTDDVWRLIESRGATTHEPRALGAVMRKAERAGVIRKVDGQWRKSQRPECHRRPLQVWNRGK